MCMNPASTSVWNPKYSDVKPKNLMPGGVFCRRSSTRASWPGWTSLPLPAARRRVPVVVCSPCLCWRVLSVGDASQWKGQTVWAQRPAPRTHVYWDYLLLTALAGGSGFSRLFPTGLPHKEMVDMGWWWKHSCFQGFLLGHWAGIMCKAWLKHCFSSLILSKKWTHRCIVLFIKILCLLTTLFCHSQATRGGQWLLRVHLPSAGGGEDEAGGRGQNQGSHPRPVAQRRGTDPKQSCVLVTAGCGIGSLPGFIRSWKTWNSHGV